MTYDVGKSFQPTASREKKERERVRISGEAKKRGREETNPKGIGLFDALVEMGKF